MFIIYLNVEPKSILHINTEYSGYCFNIHQVSQERHFPVIDARGCLVLIRKSTTQLLSVFEMPLQFSWISLRVQLWQTQ